MSTGTSTAKGEHPARCDDDGDHCASRSALVLAFTDKSHAWRVFEVFEEHDVVPVGSDVGMITRSTVTRAPTAFPPHATPIVVSDTVKAIYVVNLNVFPGPPGESTKLKPQMARIATSLASDPILAGTRGRGGFNFYGESQGGLLARSFVTQINDPPVFNLVAISGPQAGVGMCPEVRRMSAPVARIYLAIRQHAVPHLCA